MTPEATPRGYRPRRSQWDVTAAHRMHLEGRTVDEVARAVGVSAWTVSYGFRRKGLEVKRWPRPHRLGRPIYMSSQLASFARDEMDRAMRQVELALRGEGRAH